MTVPQRKINAKDSTLNMLAAVDIVEAKLTTQLKNTTTNMPFVAAALNAYYVLSKNGYG